MNTRKLVVSTLALVLAIGVGSYAFKAFSQEGGFGPRFMHGMGHGPGMMGPGMMGPGMMGHGMMGHGMMGSTHTATTAEMNDIHALLDNHDRVSRTVTNLPDGIRTVTESDDPRVIRYIKDHVASMSKRVDAGADPGLPIESEALRAIFRNKDKIKTTVETTDKGVIVVQTSADRDTVAELQQHASEVSDLVQDGMAALHTAMMRNGGMHGAGGHAGMHGQAVR
jgi:hypothetical protein